MANGHSNSRITLRSKDFRFQLNTLATSLATRSIMLKAVVCTYVHTNILYLHIHMYVHTFCNKYKYKRMHVSSIFIQLFIYHC